jgi:ribonuclease HI
LQKPILSGRLGKWAYALVEYDLKYELIRAMKGQVVADFIVDHNIDVDGAVCLADVEVWKLFFDGSVCSQGQGVGCLIMSPHGIEYELSTHLEFGCTNNQAEYEALLSGLEALNDIGVDKVEIFGDSKLVVEQTNGGSQCLDGILNEYRERCLGMMNKLERVSIKHIPREDNARANKLAQQVSGYDVRHGKFEAKQKPTLCDVMVMQGEHDESVGDTLVMEEDWRLRLISYIKNPSGTRNRKVRRQALKYTIVDEKLFRRTVEGLLLRCLGDEEAKVAMGKVHEGLCGTH